MNKYYKTDCVFIGMDMSLTVESSHDGPGDPEVAVVAMLEEILEDRLVKYGPGMYHSADRPDKRVVITSYEWTETCLN